MKRQVSLLTEGPDMEIQQQYLTTTDFRNNPHEVVEAWKQYNKQLIHDDIYGMWFAFTLTTTFTTHQLHKTLLVRAETAGKLCGLHAHNQTAGTRKHRGICAFLLPAVSYNGFPHHHGLLRVPRAYCCDEKVITTSEHGNNLTMVVPSSVREYFRLFPVRAELNLNLLYDTREDLTGTTHYALPLDADPQTASTRALSYWSDRSDGELRRFDQAVFIPWEVRAALPNADTTKEPRVSY